MYKRKGRQQGWEGEAVMLVKVEVAAGYNQVSRQRRGGRQRCWHQPTTVQKRNRPTNATQLKVIRAGRQ